MKKLVYIFMILLSLSTVGCEDLTELETSMPERPVTDSVVGVTSYAAYIVMGNSNEIVVSKTSDFSNPYYSSNQTVYNGKKCICVENLDYGTTYYYAACAVNAGYNQEMRGDVKSFTTLDKNGNNNTTMSLLVGKWYLQNFGYTTIPTKATVSWGEYIEFRSDGTFEWNNQLNGQDDIYTYTVSGSTITTHIKNNTGSFKITRLSSTELELYSDMYRYFKHTKP